MFVKIFTLDVNARLYQLYIPCPQRAREEFTSLRGWLIKGDNLKTKGFRIQIVKWVKR